MPIVKVGWGLFGKEAEKAEEHATRLLVWDEDSEQIGFALHSYALDGFIDLEIREHQCTVMNDGEFIALLKSVTKAREARKMFRTALEKYDDSDYAKSIRMAQENARSSAYQQAGRKRFKSPEDEEEEYDTDLED